MSKKWKWIICVAGSLSILSVAVIACLVMVPALVYVFIPSFSPSAQLVKAVKNGDVEKAESLLEEGVDPNQCDGPENNWLWALAEMTPDRPLSVACRNGDLELVKLLIDYGATAENRDSAGHSPMRETLFFYDPDDLEIVKLLLENGATLSLAEDGGDNNLLFLAASMWPYKKGPDGVTNVYDEEAAKGITEIVVTLKGDLSIDEVDGFGRSLLMMAVQNENIYLTEYLLSAGCDVTIVDFKGKTALDYAKETQNDFLVELLTE